ncbi:MAG TPA: transposase [Sporolactobacillaceae bacterium]|nr:transposase [Sporolactobacillaceae bacterium]
MLRGANKQEIFHDDGDYRRFLDTLEKYKEVSGVDVFGWCLMTNHVHLLIREGDEPISTTMKRLAVSYVGYYNLKYHTTGHLFQDRFRSENVESHRYLMTVIRYIHQNPIKAGMVKRAEEWKWSSCLGYYNKKVYPKGLLDKKYILSLFSADAVEARESFKTFNETVNGDQCLDNVRVSRLTDQEAREEIRTFLGAIEITQVKGMPKLQRNVLLHEIKKIEGLSQRQIARILGVSPNLIFKA